ncbi:MAG: protoheme IX farnesyltransferase [Saprospiraceae bacterium]|nr:protoheme IX farnesyltransferase [Saprospiraceae bacterium]
MAIASQEKFSKVRDYILLVKLRLSLVVVVSSILGYMVVANGNGNWVDLLLLAAGGFLVTSAANALNQVLEKDFDILMTRTANRPVATGRMKASEAVMFAGLSCLLGIVVLATFNPLTALLGMLSLIIYAFVYTPLKRYSTLAVAVGAIPGALPVMIGATAFSGTLTLFAFCLFAIQFLWQFPHFWSIGYLGFDDYKKAGYKLLPERMGQIDRNLGISSMFYAGLVIPVALFMFIRLDISIISTSFVMLCTLVYIYLSYGLHRSFDRSSALRLMFYSFFYLPLVLIAYWLF